MLIKYDHQHHQLWIEIHDIGGYFVHFFVIPSLRCGLSSWKSMGNVSVLVNT